MAIYLPQSPWQQMIPNLVQLYAQGLIKRQLQAPDYETYITGEGAAETYDVRRKKPPSGAIPVAQHPLYGRMAQSRRKLGDTRTLQVGGQNITQEWTGAGWEEIGRGSKWKPGMSFEDRMVFRQEMNSINTQRRYIQNEVSKIRRLPNLKIYEDQKAQLPELQNQLQELSDRETSLKEIAYNINLKPKPKTKQAEQEVMEKMPSASDHIGRIIVDNSTGKEYKSDGTKWIEIK